MDSIMVPPGIIILGYVWRHARYSRSHAPLALSAISFSLSHFFAGSYARCLAPKFFLR